MNPTGITEDQYGYDNNNYTFLWSVDENGTNQAFFNLFKSGNCNMYYELVENVHSTYFWSTSDCGGNLYRINIDSGEYTDSPWTLGVGCNSITYNKTQIRCVKD